MHRLLVALALIFSGVTAANAQAPFYQGKPITIIVGTKAGDAYDLYPRLLAEFLPKYIPGNPNIIIQNMPGAASLIAANHVYNVAKPDGLTIAAIYPALYFEQLTKKPQVKFDWTKFGWIGSPVKSPTSGPGHRSIQSSWLRVAQVPEMSICANAGVLSVSAADAAKGILRAVHEICARAAVNVQIDVAGDEITALQVNERCHR